MNPAELNYQPVATFENYESSRANYKMEKGAPTRQFIAGVVGELLCGERSEGSLTKRKIEANFKTFGF